MSVMIRIPAPLRKLTNEQAEIQVEATNVGDALRSLENVSPGITERLFSEDGNLRRFVNVYVGDTDVRFLDGLNTPLEGDAVVSIIPAMAGG